MDEISNRALLILVVIAVVVSLGGTFISLNKLSQLGIPITGLVSGTGIANLTVSAGTSIAVSGNINFGSGMANTSKATLDSNASNYKAMNGTGTWSWTGGQAIRIENDGNVNVSINVSTNVSRANYIGGTNPSFGAAISWEENSGAACVGVGTGAVKILDWKEINNTHNVTMCRNLTPTDANDQLNISVRLGIPEDVPNRAESVLLTFYGYTGDDR